jgi:type I restriction enzyme R subunit
LWLLKFAQLLFEQRNIDDSREHIKELLKVLGGGVIFTTIQKFAPSMGNVYENLSEKANIVVVADEFPRTLRMPNYPNFTVALFCICGS